MEEAPQILRCFNEDGDGGRVVVRAEERIAKMVIMRANDNPSPGVSGSRRYEADEVVADLRRNDLSIAAKRRQRLEFHRLKLIFDVLGSLAIAKRARLAACELRTSQE